MFRVFIFRVLFLYRSMVGQPSIGHPPEALGGTGRRKATVDCELSETEDPHTAQ